MHSLLAPAVSSAHRIVVMALTGLGAVATTMISGDVAAMCVTIVHVLEALDRIWRRVILLVGWLGALLVIGQPMRSLAVLAMLTVVAAVVVVVVFVVVVVVVVHAILLLLLTLGRLVVDLLGWGGLRICELAH